MAEAESPTQSESRPASIAWGIIAVVVFGLALFTVFAELLSRDLRAFVPINTVREDPNYKRKIGDHRFTVWAVARNARTILEAPTTVFNAEQCYPASQSLAFGEPVLTLGLAAVPAWLLTGDPIATYNWVVLGIGLFSALAMYLLVTAWTGVPAAGIIAGLLYGLGSSKLGDLNHYFIYDTAWTLLALFFAQRLFARQRWVDGIGLALCCALQIGTSFYPFLSALVIALPVGAWLTVRYGIGRRLALQLTLILLVCGIAGSFVFGPALSVQTAGEFAPRFQYFLSWSELLPGSSAFPGWLLLGLALCAVLIGRRKSLHEELGDPRWVLLVAALLVLVFAAGGNYAAQFEAFTKGTPPPIRIPNLYGWAAKIIPGLSVVRAPLRIASGFYLCMAVLAGIGAAALVRSVPLRGRNLVAVGLVLLTSVSILRPSWLGLQASPRPRVALLRPDEAQLRVFERLEQTGDTGPILELPVLPMHGVSPRVLLSAYHGRPTSACYNSFVPASVERARVLSLSLPDRSALRELWDLGFRTIVVHPQKHSPGELRTRFDRSAGEKDPPLEPLISEGQIATYAILPPPS